jgi:hypothetical protein
LHKVKYKGHFKFSMERFSWMAIDTDRVDVGASVPLWKDEVSARAVLKQMF